MRRLAGHAAADRACPRMGPAAAGKGKLRGPMGDVMTDSFGARSTLRVGEREYTIYRLGAVGDVSRLPYSLRILLGNLLRPEDGVTVTRDDIQALAGWDPSTPPDREIAYTPARVVLQDFTGVPCVVDLAAMLDAMAELAGDPAK